MLTDMPSTMHQAGLWVQGLIGSTLTGMATPAEAEQARYRQVADELRRRIQAGDYAPGSVLPSELELLGEFGVSRNTVRGAVGILRNEGLVYSVKGRGSFVRQQLPVRRLASSRYRVNAAGAPGTSFTADQGITWDQYRLDKAFQEVPAPTEVAELLGVDRGTPLLERRLVFWSKGFPQQISTSYYPLAMVEGTPVADPEREPWPGGSIAQLATLGITVTVVEESVRTRMPSVAEVDALRIPPGVPVLTITRRMLAGELPVEVAADIVIPGDRVVLDYRIDL